MNIEFDDDQAIENTHYTKFPTLKSGWLYIAIDIRHMNMSKIGLTTRENPSQRISQGRTYNPFLRLFAAYDLSQCTFGISKEELSDIEKYIHSRSVFGEPLKHIDSNRDSEWFFLDPDSAEYQVDSLLRKRGFSVDGKTLYTYYEGLETCGDIVIDRMKKIKTIYRPLPDEFNTQAERSGMPFELYQQYYNYLVSFHQREPIDKAYL